MSQADDPQGAEVSLLGSEIAQDADVGKVSPVAVSIQAEQEGPLAGNEAPDAGEVVAFGVCEACVGEEPKPNMREACCSHHVTEAEGCPPHSCQQSLRPSWRGCDGGFRGVAGMRRGQGWPIIGLDNLLCLWHLPQPAPPSQSPGAGSQGLCLLADRSHQGALPPQSSAPGGPERQGPGRWGTSFSELFQPWGGGGPLTLPTLTRRKPRHREAKRSAQSLEPYLWNRDPTLRPRTSPSLSSPYFGVV